jgi:hypothetical protein
MGTVLDLVEFRNRRAARKPKARPGAKAVEAAIYFCNGCASEEFTLSPLGAVNCAHCGALMRNISVTNPGQPGQRRPPR